MLLSVAGGGRRQGASSSGLGAGGRRACVRRIPQPETQRIESAIVIARQCEPRRQPLALLQSECLGRTPLLPGALSDLAQFVKLLQLCIEKLLKVLQVHPVFVPAAHLPPGREKKRGRQGRERHPCRDRLHAHTGRPGQPAAR